MKLEVINDVLCLTNDQERITPLVILFEKQQRAREELQSQVEKELAALVKIRLDDLPHGGWV